MANLVLEVKNSKFVNSNGRFQKKFTKNEVEANGWIVRIEDDGTIKCQAKRKYSDGVYEVRYNIHKNGYAKLTLKTPKMEKAKVIKKGFVSKKGEKINNGVLTLSGGRIDDRFAYFRTNSFINLLNKYNLKGIKHINPNQEYILIDAIQGANKRSDSIWTDGKTEAVSRKKVDNSYINGEKAYECKVKVTESNWVIINSKGKRFLYTLIKDINTLGIEQN